MAVHTESAIAVHTPYATAVPLGQYPASARAVPVLIWSVLGFARTQPLVLLVAPYPSSVQ
eukprot:2662178-Rhodomonas_salina.6